MATNQAPAFLFYAADFLVGTARLTNEEVGCYIRLLCHQWGAGAVPDDAGDRARLLGCTVKKGATTWARISEKFERGADGLWRNARLELERAKQAERRATLAANGSKGGRPPKNQTPNQTETNRFPDGNQKKSLSVCISSDPPKNQGDHTQRARDGYPVDEAFDRFFAAYPRKEARERALRAWRSLNPDGALEEEIIAVVQERVRLGWARELRFVPHPGRFLAEQRWKEPWSPAPSQQQGRPAFRVNGGTLADPSKYDGSTQHDDDREVTA